MIPWLIGELVEQPRTFPAKGARNPGRATMTALGARSVLMLGNPGTSKFWDLWAASKGLWGGPLSWVSIQRFISRAFEKQLL